MPMINIHLPTTDGRASQLTRYTQPEPDLQLLIRQLKLPLPPRLSLKVATFTADAVKTFSYNSLINKGKTH
jgi:hypothetical protein